MFIARAKRSSQRKSDGRSTSDIYLRGVACGVRGDDFLAPPDTPTNSCSMAKRADLSHPRRAIRTCSLAVYRVIPFRVRGTTAVTSRGRERSDIDTLNRRTMSLVVLIKKRQDGSRVAVSFEPERRMRVCRSWIAAALSLFLDLALHEQSWIHLCLD